MATYRGLRARGKIYVTRDCATLSPERSQRIWNHSPDGFNWGYGGSGPAQLALAILLEETDEGEAVLAHQYFKRQFVALWPEHGWAIDSCEVQACLADWREENPRPLNYID